MNLPDTDPIFKMIPERIAHRPLHAVELGSQSGFFAQRFLKNVHDSILWCVDPWDLSLQKNLPEGVGTKPETFKKWKENVKPWHGTRCHDIHGKSWDVAKEFNEEIDFLYIDGDHRFWALLADLRDWVPKVRSGGLVCGHDWTSKHWKNEVQKAVRVWLENDAPSGIEIKKGIVTKSKTECFWFYLP